MIKTSVISPTRKLEFQDYRKLRAASEDIFKHFGYLTENKLLKLPCCKKIAGLEYLKGNLKDAVINIDLETERAKREFMIAPLVSEILHQTKAKLRVSYWFEVSFQLKGYLSYFFSQNENLLLIESAEIETKRRKLGKIKNASFVESGMSKSFTQLGVELIALDVAEETGKPNIYGLISNGNTWQFAVLNRKKKLIQFDLRTFDIFADIEDLVKVIIGILESK